MKYKFPSRILFCVYFLMWIMDFGKMAPSHDWQKLGNIVE